MNNNTAAVNAIKTATGIDISTKKGEAQLDLLLFLDRVGVPARALFWTFIVCMFRELFNDDGKEGGEKC
jgi:hypothetical protein